MPVPEPSTGPRPDAKQRLRERILAGRGSIPANEREAAGAAITHALLTLPSVRLAEVVAAYVSMGSEVPTTELIRALAARGVTVLLPVLQPDSSLTWRSAHGASSERQLSEAQVVVLPGVCYDTAGHRLGRGGGSYDRALKGLPATITTVGLAWECDIIDGVPVDEHDQPVQMLVTPSRVIAINDGGN